jgi:predicted lipase
MQDAITDLCGEYQPYRGGYVHRGFLRSAKWIEEHFLTDLKRYVSKYEAQNLCIVGHSLGGAIAAMLSILLRTHIEDFVGLSPGFKLRCFAFGCPPCMSEHLADSCKSDVYSFVNETDIVPRLGYGAMSDLREMIVHTAEVLKLSGSEQV